MISEYIRKFSCNSKSNPYKIFMYLATNQEDVFTYQSSLSRQLKMNYTTLNYHITRFKQQGLINKYLKLTPKGNKLFEFIWNNHDKELLRAHNIQIVFYLSSCPINYIQRYSDAIFAFFTNRKYNGLHGEVELDFGKITLMIYSRKKAVCVLKDVYGHSDEDISAAVQCISIFLQELIERRFDGITIDRFEPARIQTSHIAYLDSTLAQKFELEGFTYEGKDVAVDKSHGRFELELTNPKNNLRGIEIVKKLEGELRKTDIIDKKL